VMLGRHYISDNTHKNQDDYYRQGIRQQVTKITREALLKSKNHECGRLSVGTNSAAYSYA